MDRQLREFVMRRDGGCVAALARDPLEQLRWPMFKGLPDPGACRTAYGSERLPHRMLMDLEYHHIKDEGAQAMGMKAPDDPDNGVAACAFHHRGAGGRGSDPGAQWMTRSDVLQALRVYVVAANEFAKTRGWPVYDWGVR